MLGCPGWSNPKVCRLDTQLAFLFKIIHGDVSVSADNLHLDPVDRRTKAHHRHKYKHKGDAAPELQDVFHYYNISQWNSHPASKVEAIIAFISCLARPQAKAAPALAPPIGIYNISQEICTRFCCALLCCGYAIVHNEFTWSIYPYSSGLLYWHWGNR